MINMETKWCLFVLLLVKLLVGNVNGCLSQNGRLIEGESSTVLATSVATDQSACSLSLNNDFGIPSPVYLKGGAFLAPDSNGDIILQALEKLTVACPGQGRYVVLENNVTNENEFVVRCEYDDTFFASRSGWTGPFKSIRCNTLPEFTSEESNDRCYGNNKVYRFGYKLSAEFLPLYEVCFDEGLMTTLYVTHQLGPESRDIQTEEQRPEFIGGGLFGKVRMSELYTKKKQAERLDIILGANVSQKYLSTTQFLARGHLAPRADFPMLAEQRATYHYANTAPQWMSGNRKWAILENALRHRVQTLGRPVTVYTGTHKVVTLADSRGHMTPIYLDVDANNNGIVPVPLYFYKMVYDPITKRATAFVTINSSFYNDSMISNLTFCDNICEWNNSEFNWLGWRWSTNSAFTFCCNYEDFVREVKHLPPLNVTGVFI